MFPQHFGFLNFYISVHSKIVLLLKIVFFQVVLGVFLQSEIYFVFLLLKDFSHSKYLVLENFLKWLEFLLQIEIYLAAPLKLSDYKNVLFLLSYSVFSFNTFNCICLLYFICCHSDSLRRSQEIKALLLLAPILHFAFSTLLRKLFYLSNSLFHKFFCLLFYFFSVCFCKIIVSDIFSKFSVPENSHFLAFEALLDNYLSGHSFLFLKLQGQAQSFLKNSWLLLILRKFKVFDSPTLFG